MTMLSSYTIMYDCYSLSF